MGTLLTFGHGYTGAALTRALARRGWRVIGTTRDPARAAAVADAGAEPLVWPGPGLEDALAHADHVLISAAPGPGGDPALSGAGKALAAAAGRIRWLGYLSTTGVYGDRNGEWVDETDELRPTTERGRQRCVAEAEWLKFGQETSVPVMIFRLAGIYGPGRGPFEKVRAGTARRIVKQGQVFSRVHVDDIAQVLVASIDRPRPGAIYNVCDDDPAPPEDVLGYAAELLGLPSPPEIAFDDAALSPMARSFYSESKRVRNDLIRDELGVRLLYPDYRSGLRALLQDG